MAYSAEQHRVFHANAQYLMQMIWHLKENSKQLDAVYVNETASGSHADFGDIEGITEQELIDTIVFWRGLVDWIEGGAVTQLDRTSNITPFVANQEPT
jgi:hypothetical protein